MPQISPISWTTIIMMSTIMIYMLNSMLMFDQKKMNKKSMKNKKKYINWKW